MRKLLGIFFGLVLLGLGSGKTLANEGIVKLAPLGEFSGRCFAASVFEDRMYRLLVTCRDLKVAFSSENNYYILWAENDEGKVFRLGEIVRGKLDTAIDQAFSKMFVTLEGSSFPRKASEDRVMEGKLEAIPFGGPITEKVEIKVTPTVAVTPTPAPLIQDKGVVKNNGSTFGKALGLVGRIVGLGVLVVIVAGVILTIVTRRKEQ